MSAGYPHTNVLPSEGRPPNSTKATQPNPDTDTREHPSPPIPLAPLLPETATSSTHDHTSSTSSITIDSQPLIVSSAITNTTLDSQVMDSYALDKPFPELLDHARTFIQQTTCHATSQHYAAEQIAAGNGIDTQRVADQWALVQQHGLVGACDRIQQQNAANYLQPQFIHDQLQEFPEYNTLHTLALDGATICRPTDWQPNQGEGVNVRKICKTMADAVHVRMAQEHALGDVLLIERDLFTFMAAAQNLEFHLTELGWVFKPGEKLSDLLGRIIDDYTNSPGPLNTDDTRLAMETLYGALHLPQLEDMCARLLNARDAFPNQAILGLKEDVSRAYRRIRVRPADCPIMGVLLPPTQEGVTYIAFRLSQPFGHNASGHSWGVVSRAIMWHMDRTMALHQMLPPTVTLNNLGAMYVDDEFTFANLPYLKLTSLAFISATQMAGANARDASKADISPSLMTLGWTFMDHHDAVLPSTKGWFSLLHIFFHVVPLDLKKGDQLTAGTLLRMGALASRYSRALLPLAGFCQGFHTDASDAIPVALRRVSARTVQDTQMWRTYLQLIAAHPMLMSTPVSWPAVIALTPDQQAERADGVAFVDACTSQRAIGIFMRHILWCQFQFPTATYFRQNQCEDIHINLLEMTGVVAGAIVAILHAPPMSHLHVWCDNTASVGWSHSNRVNTPLACMLTQMLTLLGASRRVLVTVGWIAGEENIMADAISRLFNVPNGPQLQQELQQSACRQVFVPRTFMTALETASEMRQCLTSQIAQLVHTVLDGANT